MNNEILKTSITDVIKANGNQEITGDILQQSLIAIINQFGSGSIFGGFAVPTTVPTNTDVNMFYMAKVPGTYTNFGGYILEDGKIAVFNNTTGVWVAENFIDVKSLRENNPIVKTSTVGLVDTYTIYYSDGTNYEFLVTNGSDAIVDGVVEQNNIDAVSGGEVWVSQKPIRDVTEFSKQMADNTLIEFGGYNGTTGNAQTTTSVKRLPTITITSDMVGQNTISGFGILAVTYARVAIKSTGGTVQYISVGTTTPLDKLTFEITPEMIGSFLRFSIGNVSAEPADGYQKHFMWVKGSVALPYAPKDSYVFNIDKIPTSSVINDTLQPINSKAVKDYTVLKTEVIGGSGKNLFNKATAQVGYIGTDGVYQPSATTYRVSDFIDTTNDKQYKAIAINVAGNDGMRYVTAYDANNVVIPSQGINAGTNASVYGFNFPASSGVKKVRVSIYLGSLDSFQLEQNTESTSYEPYQFGLKSVLGIPVNNTSYSPILNLIAEGDSTTEGADLTNMVSERWTTLLQTALGSAYNVVNRGTSGARAEEIISRISARNPKIRVTSGTITANTRNTLTYLDIQPLRAGATGYTYTYPAVLINYNGVVAKGYMTKFNTNEGFFSLDTANVSVGATDLYLVSTANKFLNPNVKLNSKDLFIVGFGANNIALITAGTQTVDYLKQCIIDLFSAYPLVMFWGQTDRGLSELTIINQVEDYCIKEFGTKFCPVRRYLASPQSIIDAKKINPSFVETQEDLDRIAAGSIPPSLKFQSASAHLNALGHQLQMNFIKNWLIQYYL